jgi:hypothetical protein
VGNHRIVVGLVALGFLTSSASVRAQDSGTASFPAPAAVAPAEAPPAPVPVAETQEPLQLRTPVVGAPVTTLLARPGVAFYVEQPSGQVERLCLAPCTTSLTGEQRLRLGLDGDDPEAAPERVLLSPGSVIEGEYASRSSTRIAGWIIFGIGFGSGVATIATGMGIASNGGDDERATGAAIIAGGAITLLVSTVMGLVMGLQSDDAHVHVRPAAQ